MSRTVWKYPEKTKNLKLIKMAQNGNRAKRKCHNSFFAFYNFKLKTAPIHAELNCAPRNQYY